MQKKLIFFLMFPIVFLLISGCTTAGKPPTVEFCLHQISSGVPSVTVLLYPDGAPIKEIELNYDRWPADAEPPALVKEDAISALNGRLYRRADPITPANWWTLIPEDQWSSTPLESLTAVSLEWDFSPPLEADEQLVYELELTYITPEGGTLLAVSDRYHVTAGFEINVESDMCKDFMSFKIGG